MIEDEEKGDEREREIYYKKLTYLVMIYDMKEEDVEKGILNTKVSTALYNKARFNFTKFFMRKF